MAARAEAERAAAEETRTRAAAEAAGRRLAVLYDANYLMDGSPLLHDVPGLLGCRVTGIVPVEVQQEIEGLFNDERAKRRASTGRGRVVALKEAQTFRVQYAEVRLAEAVRAVQYGGPLMPDSRVDSLLIEYGRLLARSGEYRAVVIATGDGGIRNKVFDDRAATGLPLFAVANPTAPNQIEPVRAALHPPPVVTATAGIESVRVEFGTVVEGRAGLTVHTLFRVKGARGVECNLTALFWTADGKPVAGYAPYTTGGGQLGNGESFVPLGEVIRYDDFRVFIPYEAFRLPPGTHQFFTRVAVSYQATVLLWSNPVTFTLTAS